MEMDEDMLPNASRDMTRGMNPMMAGPSPGNMMAGGGPDPKALFKAERDNMNVIQHQFLFEDSD